MNEQKTAWIKISMIFVLFFALMGVGFAGTVGDVNGDGEVSLAEAIHALQVIAGLRPGTTVDECIGTCSGTLSAGGRWCDQGDGTVKDMTSGLIWCKSPWPFINTSWYAAIIDTLGDVYYSGTYGIYDGGFRIPSQAEFSSLRWGEEPVSPSNMRFFTNVSSTDFYWTATSLVTNPTLKKICRIDGNCYDVPASETHPVWPVRAAYAGYYNPW